MKVSPVIPVGVFGKENLWFHWIVSSKDFVNLVIPGTIYGASQSKSKAKQRGKLSL